MLKIAIIGPDPPENRTLRALARIIAVSGSGIGAGVCGKSWQNIP